MEVRTFLLATIAILGFLSGLLGFIAEGKKLVESDITHLPSDECVHGRGPALVLGMVAAVALLVAQIISNSLGGCICCESGASDPCGKSTPTAVAISFLTLSWITFSIAFLLLVAGASINDRRDTSDNNLSTGCFVLKSGVFTGAAFASMTTAVLGIAYNLQVFSIRKTMGSMVVGSMDGGPSSSEVTTNSGNMRRSAMASQEFMATARPVFSPEQAQKIKAAHDHRSAYPRSAVVPERDIGNLEMASAQLDEPFVDDYMHMRGALANTEPHDMQALKQIRKSVALEQQGYPSRLDSEYYHEKEDARYGSQHAHQSASAAYNMHGRDASHSQYDSEQDALRPLYRRSGDGNVGSNNAYQL